MFQNEFLELMLPTMESLLKDADRFKQRAGTEMLIGLLRGTLQALRPSIPSELSYRFEALAETVARSIMGLVHVQRTGSPQ